MEIETLRGVMEASAKYGISTDLVHLPALKPGDTGGCPASIKLAQDPERDEDIALFCRAIENAGAVGLRGICWHFCVLENQRSPATPGRGGTATSSLYATDYDNDTLCEAAVLNGGYVTRDEVFERIAYLLERIVPVAERCKVQLCCHLSDPPAPVLRGVERWDWPVVEGINRFLALYESPYHGMNLCCGTASEGMDDPATELLPLVKDLAERKKIFNIHYRNINGGLMGFQEVWPDEGDINMMALAQTLWDGGYDYMLMPDHAPTHPDDKPIEGACARATAGWSFQVRCLKGSAHTRGCWLSLRHVCTVWLHHLGNSVHPARPRRAVECCAHQRPAAAPQCRGAGIARS
jgi:mannonate dehydratase